MSHPVTWFHFSAKDPKKLEAFYKKAFAWKIHPGAGDTGMVQPEGGGIAGGIGGSPDGRSGVDIYIETKDLAASLKAVEAAGGRGAMPPMELPEGMGSIATFTDPEGIHIGLWAPGKAVLSARAASKKPAVKKAPAKKAAAKKPAAKKPAAKRAPAKKAPAKKAKKK